MPAEAHRLHHPVGPRERRLLAVLACAAALAVAVALVLDDGRPQAQVEPGCVAGTVAGVMGSGTIAGCGRGATRLCRMYATTYAALAAQCEALRRSR